MAGYNTTGILKGPSPPSAVKAEEANPEIVVTAQPISRLDALQMLLDVVGLIPALGAPADILNAIISGARGDWLGAGLSLFGVVPVAGEAATAAKIAKNSERYAAAVAKVADEILPHLPASVRDKLQPAIGAARKKIDELAGGRKAAPPAPKPKPPPKQPQAGGGGKDGMRSRPTRKRKPRRRCELVPYDELQCDEGLEAHHVIPDWMLRLGKRGGTERIPDMPSLAKGPAICLEKGAGKPHTTAHKHTDRPAQRIARSGRGSGTPGTITLGQAKGISSRAIEKATGGKGKGGCEKADIRKQLDEQFKGHDQALLRGVRDARGVTNTIKDAVNPTGPRGK
jgi:hypothetical protein